ncbi:precorrin-2 C(20)-methyltransferase [Roseobacter denitrificans]|uniref:Precorrin-2 C20-methyltransferase n=1 Tax=Roseobacter denitrificans (strain ATCC 33942 / OCh 114) TaxID=375451 RepID=Q161Q5_ROSDO|nr:precorrin-2 C(20)-methyltransferase [Roseobacter denitrificans]ABG33288.1 precorrin-2 C20-methyltransferase [Roseobacter denitrificans OCh 114]AVL52627.1 precorrin-2 C(20)-methyltransferase [Roseobacter denitrificans]SFG22225.1 precorrin-2 C20-methyltransferase [Roseobacter denitrificans OCh 114]
MTGTLYGVGLGPGDPELMSVKSDRLVRQTRNIAYFRKKGRSGRARTIVDGMLRDDVVLFAMEYPVTTEIPLSDPRYNASLSAFYSECTAHLQKLVEAGEDVVVLCEGDPFFYGSFMHVYTRLKDSLPIEVVPAITGMSAAWTASGAPITWGDDILSTVMGTLDEETLTKAMTEADALVVMKIGRNLPKVRRALAAAGKAERAILVKYASMEGQEICPLAEFGAETLPYFSIIIVHGQGRRP